MASLAQIIVNAVSHDGKNLITPAEDWISIFYGVYGHSVKVGDIVADPEFLHQIRLANSLIDGLSQNLEMVVRRYERGSSTPEIFGLIRDSVIAPTVELTEACSLLQSLADAKVLNIPTDGDWDGLPVPSGSLVQCAEALLNYLRKVGAIGEHMDDGDTGVADIGEQFDDALRDIKSKYPEVNVELAGHPVGNLAINKDVLFLMLREILSNSFKYRSSNNLKIEVYQEKTNGNTIHIIKDNGIGMESEECSEKIWKPNTRLNHHKNNIPGQGNGLNIVKLISRYLNLNITCESKLGLGSSFSIFIPDDRVVAQ